MKFLLKIIIFALKLSFVFSAFANNQTLISIDVQNISVKNILQILAKKAHKNIILSNDINNKTISLHVENMPWEKILAIILKQQNLSLQQSNGVFMIASMQENIKNDSILPLTSVMVIVRYAKATDIAALIKNQAKSLLSSRGYLTADPRTNALWIADIDSKITDIKKFIQQIDIPVKQVLIEARIVTIGTQFEQELGARLGLNNVASKSDDQKTKDVSPAHTQANFSVDLPATSPHAGSMGISMVTFGQRNLLDLELSALEKTGSGEIISKPRIITADQQPASILSGQAIPYQASTESGATNVAFEKAVLSLTVTPQIMPNDRLLLTLKVNQDRPGTTLVQGVPEIDTREIKTQILINNRQTLVLGGIYEKNQQKAVQQIPFFSKIPILGRLFKHDSQENSQQELLIFVTPEIID